MATWANRLLLCLNIVVLTAAVLYFGLHPVIEQREGIEYKDLITIILTAIAVLLAAVTIFIAMMAIWGYNSIREESVKVAKEEANKVARDVAQAVAAREAEGVAAISGGNAPQPDIMAMDDLAKALQAGEGE